MKCGAVAVRAHAMRWGCVGRWYTFSATRATVTHDTRAPRKL